MKQKLNTIETLKSGWMSLRALFARKLGRCPMCMRASIIGSALSWIALAIVYFFVPTALLLVISSLVAVSFTVLMLTHICVFMARMGRALRELHGEEDRTSLRLAPNERAISRWQFMTTIAKGGIAFAFAALLPARGHAQGIPFACVYVVQGVAETRLGGCQGISFGDLICEPCTPPCPVRTSFIKIPTTQGQLGGPPCVLVIAKVSDNCIRCVVGGPGRPRSHILPPTFLALDNEPPRALPGLGRSATPSPSPTPKPTPGPPQGITIPDSAKEKPQEAPVHAMGPGKIDDGKKIPFEPRARRNP
ncbi:MAG: DUF3624 family protein [Verrucomicrobia bacterium]|nr:DUF3624 family protein [Verrucomicrobiota bacterium]